MTDPFSDRLRSAARSAPMPKAPEGLVDRVVAERSAGERIILPGDVTTRRTPRLGFTIGLLIAAAAVVAILVVPASMHRADSPAVEIAQSDDGLFVSTLRAEQLPTAPLAPPVRGMNGSKIVARSYSYRLQYVDSTGRVTPDGGGTVTVSEAQSPIGAAAWRIVLNAEQTEDGQRRAASETLFVARGTLEPLTRVVHVRPYLRYSAINIRQRVSGDSLTGEMTTDGGVHRTIAQKLPKQFGPFLSDAIAPLALAGVTLANGWSGAVSILGWGVVGRDVFYPATLRVIGEERIATPHGSFDCWKIAVVSGRQRRTEWVRKSDGLGLRSYDEAATPKGHRQFMLLDP